MSFLSKLGRKVRFFGEKVAHGARVVGNKVGDFLLGASPVLSAINPTLGAAAASAGGVAKGIGAIGGAVEGFARGRSLDVGGIRAAAKDVGTHAKAVRDAYNAGSSQMRSAIERASR